MKQLIASLAALVLGIGIGVGIGMTLSKSKTTDLQAKIDTLQTQIQTSKAESEKTIQKASEVMAGLNKTVSSYKTMNDQLKTELARTKAELMQFQGPNETPTAATPTQPAEKPTAASVPSTEYTVKDGDNLWKIAEQQLGNGMRLQEIIRLNSGITEETVLQPGMKLKIPSQKN